MSYTTTLIKVQCPTTLIANQVLYFFPVIVCLRRVYNDWGLAPNHQGFQA
jgi:hypothetical protein